MTAEFSEWSEWSFITTYKWYAKYSTDAPQQYAEVMAIQLLGHAMGYQPAHLIQPKAVRHNMYTIFVGKSTLTRKTTSQELGKDIYPFERWLSTELSPERMIEELSEYPERMAWLGEFTALLKGIKSGGYMSRLAELYNDLHGCPANYKRSLRTKKDQKYEFHIKNCYLSANSTTTPEMLKQYLTEEIMEGGFLARWIIVPGEPNPKPRKRLHPDVFRLNEVLRSELEAIINMPNKEVSFIFSDDALKLYNEIEQEVYEKYDKVPAFAGRYLNYLVSFADIIMVSDAIGAAVEQGKPPHTFRDLDQLIRLIQLEQLDEGINGIKSINYSKCSKRLIIVPRLYVEQAWRILQPCLDYTTTLVDYVELDRPTAKLMEYLRRVKEASHSKCMQYTHLSAWEMENAVRTLRQRGDIEIINEEIERKGAGRITKNIYKWIGK